MNNLESDLKESKFSTMECMTILVALEVLSGKVSLENSGTKWQNFAQLMLAK